MIKDRTSSPVSLAIALAGAVLGSSLFATTAFAVHPLNVPGPGAKVAPPAADGGLGEALLGAHVSSSGTLIAGSGATGIIKIGTGTYEVDFNRNVSSCFYNAASFTSTVPVFVEPRGGNVNGVFIVFDTLGTTAANPAATDSEFYMTVYCGN